MNQKKVAVIGGIILLLVIFSSQLARLLTFFRNRLTGKVVTDSVLKKVATDSAMSVGSVSSLIRTEYCKGVASSVYAALHEKPFGFLPRGIFGSTEDEDKIISELNSLNNGKEAAFVSSYYYEKYQLRMKGLLIKYLSTSEFNSIRAEVRNNLN